MQKKRSTKILLELFKFLPGHILTWINSVLLGTIPFIIVIKGAQAEGKNPVNAVEHFVPGSYLSWYLVILCLFAFLLDLRLNKSSLFAKEARSLLRSSLQFYIGIILGMSIVTRYTDIYSIKFLIIWLFYYFVSVYTYYRDYQISN